MKRPSTLLQSALPEALPLLKALANERRCRMLETLAGGPCTITKLAAAVELDQATVSQHASTLEKAGLVRSRPVPGVRGQARLVELAFNNILLHLPAPQESLHEEHVVDMPIGLYSGIHVTPPCGFATALEIEDPVDSPATFHHPKRTEAELIWLSDGHITYSFPCQLPAGRKPERLEISAELCSEVMDYNEDYPSEVTLWVDDREAGTVRLPGDMGARYGRHTPAWVPDWHTKYGFLTTWTVDDTGSQVNEEPASPLTLDELRLDPGRPITVRFGFRQGDVHGGMNLFGGNFGDHGQAIRMKLTTRPAKTPAELLLDEMQSLLVTETAAESSAERAQNEGASPAETVRE